MQCAWFIQGFEEGLKFPCAGFLLLQLNPARMLPELTAEWTCLHICTAGSLRLCLVLLPSARMAGSHDMMRNTTLSRAASQWAYTNDLNKKNCDGLSKGPYWAEQGRLDKEQDKDWAGVRREDMTGPRARGRAGNRAGGRPICKSQVTVWKGKANQGRTAEAGQSKGRARQEGTACYKRPRRAGQGEAGENKAGQY